VNSEHQKYIPDDARRSERIESQTTKAGHPYTQFRTGSLETLWTTPREKGIDIRAALFNFHEKYYSSNIMNLVLMGAEGLDELQTMAEDIFLDVPNRNRTMEVWNDNPCGSEELGERLDIVPTGDKRSLNIIFPVDSIGAYYKNSVRTINIPMQYLIKLYRDWDT
jgi:insulysin